MFGAKLTLIVLTSQRLARIDLAGSRRHLRVERVLSCPAIASSQLASAVAIAYRLGETPNGPAAVPNLSRRSNRSLVVLSDDIWNDTISLPLDVTVLLQPAEIQQALTIEAESYSGISAFNSRCVSRQLIDTSSKLLDASTNFSATTSWWVAQIANSDLNSLTTSAHACGVKFLGATHWHAPWRANQISPIAIDDLNDPSTWRQFGQHWAATLSQDGFELLIRPDSVDTSRQRLGWIQTSTALATVLTCAGIYYARTSQLHTAQSQLQQLQKTQSEFETVASRLRAAETKLQQSRAKSATADAPRTPLLITKAVSSTDVSSAQWLAIFDALTAQTPEDCCIESWRSNSGQLVLVGRAVSAQAIHELARRLEPALHDYNWQVLPPIIEPVESQLLRFELIIELKQSARGPSTRTTSASTSADHTVLADNSTLGGRP